MWFQFIQNSTSVGEKAARMAPLRPPSKRAAAKAANEKITALTAKPVKGSASVKGSSKQKSARQKQATAAKKVTVKKVAIKKAAVQKPVRKKLTVNKVATDKVTAEEPERAESTSSWTPPKMTDLQDERVMQETMGQEMWRFQRRNKNLELIKAELQNEYHARNNPYGVEYVGMFLVYRYPPGQGPKGCSYAMQEPVTRTWKFYNLPADTPYWGGGYNFPAGFTREHSTFNIHAVWEYRDDTRNVGRVMLRVEHKVSKKCRLMSVREVDETSKHNFHYPKKFVTAGKEGENSYYQMNLVDEGGLYE
jgi:hypothetical protein